jgi:hypothetical protein
MIYCFDTSAINKLLDDAHREAIVSNRCRDDEGFVTENACTETCGGLGRFIGMPVLRECGGYVRDYPAPELSVDGSPIAKC